MPGARPWHGVAGPGAVRCPGSGAEDPAGYVKERGSVPHEMWQSRHPGVQRGME